MISRRVQRNNCMALKRGAVFGLLTACALPARSACFIANPRSHAAIPLQRLMSTSSPYNEMEKIWEESAVPTALNFVDTNDSRYSASDWYHNIKSLPRSSILREVKTPVLTIMAWSTFVSVIHWILRQSGAISVATRMCISNKPHSFLVSALGLLLVFRTNSAYQRFTVSHWN